MNAPVILSGGGLWIEFYWTGDRWGHRVGFEPDRVAILESIEGTSEEDWPPSPALQELHIEPRPDGKQLALLVGMAGTSHWSMSVELDAAKGQVVFDAACRVKQMPTRLGNAYEVRSPQCLGAACDPESHVRCEQIDTQVRVFPTKATEQVPMTVCWRYAISRQGSLDKFALHLYCQAV